MKKFLVLFLFLAFSFASPLKFTGSLYQDNINWLKKNYVQNTYNRYFVGMN